MVLSRLISPRARKLAACRMTQGLAVAEVLQFMAYGLVSGNVALAQSPTGHEVLDDSATARPEDEYQAVRALCLESIRDAAQPQNCLRASSTPRLGLLLPLSEALNVTPEGRVGIGTTTPIATLDVNGTVRMRGFQLTTDPTVGYVLTTDASGNGMWAPTSLSLPYIGIVTSSNDAIGIYNFGNGRSVYGRSVGNTGVQGESVNNVGVLGSSQSTYGVYGTRSGGSRPTDSAVFGQGYTGVHGNATSPNGYGVYGTGALGVRGDGGVGVWGTGGTGLYGVSYSGSDTYGVYGHSDDGMGVYGRSFNGHAGYFDGTLTATGNKMFQIDHPLDPENKYLNHYCTESPKPQNAYNCHRARKTGQYRAGENRPF